MVTKAQDLPMNFSLFHVQKIVGDTLKYCPETLGLEYQKQSPIGTFYD